jgi:hypothetical protein
MECSWVSKGRLGGDSVQRPMLDAGAFDAWLHRGLLQADGITLDEPLPQEWLSMVDHLVESA